jgi:DNA-directed RNA polymerase specialized sigma24 family protein
MLARRRSVAIAAEEAVTQRTDAWVQLASTTASHYARRIVRSLGLAAEDLADLRQELLLEVVRRAPRFDPARAAWPTFIDMIIRHAADELAARLVCGQRHNAGFLDDLTTRRHGVRVPLTEVVTEGEGASALWSGAGDSFTEVDRRIDIERFVERLPDGLRRLCRLLQTELPADAQRLSGLSRSEFYRQLDELAMRLRAFGLAEGTPWEKSDPGAVHKQ